MNHYLLDTNIILYYMRREAEKTQIIDRLYAPSAAQNKVFLSIVTVAELHAIALRHQWGNNRWNTITAILRKVVMMNRVSTNFIENK